ncbi:MAG: phage tail tube protein, partial [Acidobacteriota bacterium]
VMEPHPIEFGHFLRAALGQSSSTIQSSVAAFNDFKHVFHPRNADFDGAKAPVPPYTLQLHRDFEDAFQFTDSIATRLEMRIEGGDFVRATVNMISRTTSLMTKTTPSFISDRPWTWAVASLQIGGTAVDFVENMTIVFENAVEGVSTLAGRRFGKFGRTGFAQVLISGRLDLSNLNQYDEFVAASETNMIMHLAQNVSSGPYMTITVPRFRWSGIPVQVGGPGRIAVDFSAKGIHHVNSNTAIDFTLINTRNAYQ